MSAVPLPATQPAGWSIAAARAAGTAHIARGARCEDAWRVCPVGDAVAIAVADGAGSAARAQIGASRAVRALCDAAAATLRTGQTVKKLRDDTVTAWFANARAGIEALACREGQDPRAFSSTALLVLADETGTLAAHIGDGAAVLRDPRGEWWPLSLPAKGSFAGETVFLIDPTATPRLSRCAFGASAIAAFTDGLERMLLDLSTGAPSVPFFDKMLAPMDAVAQAGEWGRNTELSSALERFLTSEPVTKRTDDDVTLVLAARGAG